MKYIYKSIIFWVLAFLIGAFIAVFQRMTGPTYPKSGEVTIENTTIDYDLIRTYDGDDDATISIMAENNEITGFYRYKRFKSNDEWTIAPLSREGKNLIAKLPHQPPAGKITYQITLANKGKEVKLTDEPIIIRFKGAVPSGIVWSHVFAIFFAFIFSVRTGFEAMIKGKYTFQLTIITLILLLTGGLILGPIMQKFAFGAYWTGWPFGHDLTDNKTAVAFIFWLVAFFVQIKRRKNRVWPVIASIVLLIIFLIPHSVLGSEIDYTKHEAENQTEISE